MIFKCEIEMDNAAFDPDPLLELRRLLINAAMRFEQLQGSDPLGWDLNNGWFIDINGNKVGRYTIEGKD
tara:strand:- start:17 stop:223 length:207 start_codon:yes stop_codon:yes gene_type:complete